MSPRHVHSTAFLILLSLFSSLFLTQWVDIILFKDFYWLPLTQSKGQHQVCPGSTESALPFPAFWPQLLLFLSFCSATLVLSFLKLCKYTSPLWSQHLLFFPLSNVVFQWSFPKIYYLPLHPPQTLTSQLSPHFHFLLTFRHVNTQRHRHTHTFILIIVPLPTQDYKFHKGRIFCVLFTVVFVMLQMMLGTY